MRRVLAHIKIHSERFAQEPMFEFLRDDRIPVEQKLCFMPMMAHFVFSFMDVNQYVLRNEAIDSPFQRLVNIHSYEDATHWPWWVSDMKTAGLDKACTFTDAMLFAWSDSTRRSRLLTYEFIAIAATATPVQLLAIVETVESTGYKFLSTTAEVCRKLELNPYVYYGNKHANVESGHHMGTDDAIGYLEAIVLSDEELAKTLALVDRLYKAYTEFVAEMYAWVKSHNVTDLRSGPFFSERVSGEVSRPLNEEELARLRTPIQPLRTAAISGT